MRPSISACTLPFGVTSPIRFNALLLGAALCAPASLQATVVTIVTLTESRPARPDNVATARIIVPSIVR